MKKAFLSSSPAETEAAGEALAAQLKKGMVIALAGGLGAGKTCFARGLLRAFSIKDAVTSPTYTIINHYEGIMTDGAPVQLYHIDAYRLQDADSFVETGGAELLGGEGICIVEWPEIIAELIPAGVLHVKINIKNCDIREIVIN